MVFNFVNQGSAQTDNCNCKTDLIFFENKITKTPPYKKNKESFDSAFNKAVEKAEKITSVYECYVLLNTLLLSLNDNHSKVYGLNKGAAVDEKNDTDNFLKFKNSDLFKVYPKPNIDIDSLTSVLSSKEIFEIEGIYRKDGYMTIGIYKHSIENIYQAIVIDSKNELWRIGEVVYTIIPYGNNYLLHVGGNVYSKRLIAYTERIENGFCIKSGFKKDTAKINYATKLPAEETYFREELTPDITYIKIGSFSGFNPTLSQAETFYKTLEGTLTKRHMILDLRNNGGGGPRNSDLLFKILKSYLRNNNIYVLTNHITASNAEQFTYKLSEFKKCQIFGQQSNGTLTYELTGKNYELPCGNFIAVLTSKSHLDYIHLESVGIEPSVKFDMASDWINQLVNYIEAKE